MRCLTYVCSILILLTLNITPLAGENEAPADRDLPTYFSWGDYDGCNWMPPVGNQGSCGSCWAFCIARAYEARLRIMVDNCSLTTDLAEGYMVACWAGSCGSVIPNDMLADFQAYGCPTEECHPYVYPYYTPCAPCPDYEDELHYITAYDYWSTPTVAEIKQEIHDNGPVISLMATYTDFYPYSGGVYQLTTGTYQGRKTVLLYGWDDTENCWLAQNTWGTSWGELGPDGTTGWFRIRMGFNEVEIEENIYVLTPLPPASCCIGERGNVVLDIGTDCTDITDQTNDIGDLTNMIDHLFISFAPICCEEEADIAPAMSGGSADGIVDIADLTAYINYLFITFPAMPDCP